jgi:hypothetical protein
MTPELASAIAAAISASAAAIALLVAIGSLLLQRRAVMPRVSVRVLTQIPVYTGVRGTDVGEPWIVILVHNAGIVPVVVNSAALATVSGGTLPYLSRPGALGGIGDDLAKPLGPGEEASLWMAPIRDIAREHAGPNGPFAAATATLAGGREFRSKRFPSNWLESWRRPAA